MELDFFYISYSFVDVVVGFLIGGLGFFKIKLI